MADSLVYEKLEGECAEYLKTNFTSRFRTGYRRCNGFVLPEYYQEFGQRIQSMEIFPDDIWICSIPKTGTTWVQEAVWCIANNVDLETAKKRTLAERFPFLEGTALHDDRALLADNASIEMPAYDLDSVDYTEKFPSPRFIKTHLPFVLLPEKLKLNKDARIVYVARNPRDTCISYYHHCRYIEGYRGTFEMFCELFLQGTVNYLPYWDHVLQFWRIRDKPNVLFITYEEMKQDLRGGILKIAKFLGKTLNEQQVHDLTEHLSFENMKKNRTLNREAELDLDRKYDLKEEFVEGTFMRSGRTGQWKDVMSHSMAQRFQKWELENLRMTDYPLVLD